ncbi:MAG: glycosyltransferase family 2 protein [Candidatus Omnitrophica bacterium]|nr:glycosyltransferase family 2 protein [Candidatus Omnitrophota bacterium]
MNVSVIIVSIGAKDYLKLCLNSLLKQSHQPLEIIIIDNSSQPDFARNISKAYPSVKLYSSPKNLFYAAALNKGISSSSGDFVLCLNDDVVLGKEFIREALKGFLVDNRIGSVSGKILRSDGKVLDSAGLYLSVWRTAKEKGYGQKDSGQFEKNNYIFGASGAAAFYRREMLESIKECGDYFDSDFGMFYEDLDISWRAHRYGWLAYYIPAALVYHVRGGSFRPDCGIGKPVARKYLNDQLHCALIKNRYLTILKNETFCGFIAHLIPILIYDLCVWGYVVFFRPRVFKLFFNASLRQINEKRQKMRCCKKRF